MSLEVASQLLHCNTAFDLWQSARDLTCASMKSQVLNLKGELHKIRKNSMKMKDYLNKLKTLSDQLSLVGAPVSLADLVMHTLHGLDAEYNAAVFTLNRQSNISWVEVQSELLSFESRLEQQQQMNNLSIQPSANFIQRDDGHVKNSGAGNTYSGQSGPSLWRGGSSSGGHGQRGRGRNPRGGRRGGFSGNRPYCALCEKPGHAVHNCFHRFDRNFQPPTHGRGFGGSSGQFSQSPHAFYAGSADGYGANPRSVADPCWYMDSGANYHVTPFSDQLENYTQVGKTHLFTCTGEKTKVVGIGSTSLSTSSPKSKLILNDVLLVPSATKNLVSVNRLTQDNAVNVCFTNKIVL